MTQVRDRHLTALETERFVRDPSGTLIAVDLRPINFDSSTRDTLRIGFDFSKPLKSRRPSQSVMDQIRAQFRGARGGTSPATGAPAGGTPQGAAQPDANAPPPGPPAGGPPNERPHR